MSFRTNSPAVQAVLSAYLLDTGKIKAEFLPSGQGDLSAYYTKVEADAAFLTQTEADALYLTETLADAAYAALGHDHVAADITDLSTAIDTAVATAVGEIEIPAADSSVALNVAVVDTNFQAANTNHIIITNLTVAGPATVTLPTTPTTGKMLIIKDGKGDANTNTVTIAGNGKTIDGGASVTITAAYEAVTLVYNGTQWNII